MINGSPSGPTPYEHRMKNLLLVFCFLAFAGDGAAIDEGLYPLTVTGALSVEVLRTDDDTVTLRKDSGVERISWWDLDLLTADRIGHASGQFRILDQQNTQIDDFHLTRVILSRILANGTIRYYVHGRYSFPKQSGRQNAHWPDVDSPPQFTGNDTILIISNHILLAYRDFDVDNVPDMITIQRPVTTVGNKIFDDDPENKNEHVWRVIIETNDRAYVYEVHSKKMPQPPEPYDGRGEYITLNKDVVKLSDIEAGRAVPVFISNDIDPSNPEPGK